MKELSIEDKELLLKDLCVRLPYRVMCHIEIPHSFIGFVEKGDLILISITSDTLKCDFKSCWGIDIDYVKPYLRPMSSMTEEEKLMYEGLMIGTDNVSYMLDVIDWLNAHHFDYRGLIEKGLALEAPEGMYNIKEK